MLLKELLRLLILNTHNIIANLRHVGYIMTKLKDPLLLGRGTPEPDDFDPRPVHHATLITRTMATASIT